MPRSALAEFRTLGLLALPIIVTQLSQMGMGVMDAMMAGRVSAADLAGVTLGGNLYFPVMLLMSGLIMAVTPSVSQLHGAGRLAEAGTVVRQALWIAVIGGAAVVAALRHAEPVYRALGVDPEAIPVAVAYLDAASLGLVPLLAYASLRCLCEGMAWTKPAMFISLSALGLKLPLNWAFVYGVPALGVPALGGVGCGWATAIVMAYSLAAMLVVVLCSRTRAAGVFASFAWPRLDVIARLARLGLPIGMALFLEVAFFSFVTLLIGRLGVDTVASHQVAFNVSGVAFMIPLALGMAATIRVGFLVGAGDPAGARRAAWVAVSTTLCWGLAMATLMLAFRTPIVSLYSTEPAVVQLAAALLVIGAAFQVFDAGQATMMGALRGYKDATGPMLIAMVAYWILGLPTGYVLCFGAGPFAGIGVQGFWWGLVAGLATAAAALAMRLAAVSRRPVGQAARAISYGSV